MCTSSPRATRDCAFEARYRCHPLLPFAILEHQPIQLYPMAPSPRLLHTHNLLPHHTLLLTPTRPPPHALVIYISRMPPHTNILPELARRQPRLKHLVNLLKRSVLDLGEVKVHPYDGEEAGWAPDPACEVLVCGEGRRCGEWVNGV